MGNYFIIKEPRIYNGDSLLNKLMLGKLDWHSKRMKLDSSNSNGLFLRDISPFTTMRMGLEDSKPNEMI